MNDIRYANSAEALKNVELFVRDHPRGEIKQNIIHEYQVSALLNSTDNLTQSETILCNEIIKVRKQFLMQLDKNLKKKE